MSKRAPLIALTAALTLAACGADADRPAPKPPTAATTVRAAVPQPVCHVDTFAGRLYAELAKEQGTFAFSPYSVSAALAMAAEGASGVTRAELERAACAPPDLDRLNRDGVRLDVANALWGQRGIDFEQPFLDTLEQRFGAPLQTVDFGGDPSGAAARINAWIKEKTHGKIEGAVDPGALDELTRFILANAVYLKARWADPFEPGATGPDVFHAPDGDVTTPFMHEEEYLSYVDGDGYQTAELPYVGRKLAMDVILPDRGQLADVEERIAAGELKDLVSGLDSTDVDLALPKVDLASAFDLVAPLKALGLEHLFTGADFSRISRQEPLHIDAALHRATLTVDEEGTEASAVTVIMGAAGASREQTEPVHMRVDRPYLMVVRDLKTSTPLFLARIEDPTAR